MYLNFTDIGLCVLAEAPTSRCLLKSRSLLLVPRPEEDETSDRTMVRDLIASNISKAFDG